MRLAHPPYQLPCLAKERHAPFWPHHLRQLHLCHIRHILHFIKKADKPLVWLKSEIKTPPFSAQARVEAGVRLRRLQRGENISLPHSRPMPNIGKACHELRIQDAGKTWRIVYHIDAVAIVILDVFPKTTQTTPKTVIATCKARLEFYKSI
jgi:phage-related protein